MKRSLVKIVTGHPVPFLGVLAIALVFVGCPPITQVDMPTFSPAAGTYNSDQSVTIDCSTPGATIYYTTDGTDPTASSSSAVYNGAIAVTGDGTDMTIKAIGAKSWMRSSELTAAKYTIYYFTFKSETLTTLLVPAPYVIDASPTGEFGLNGTTWYVDGTNGSDSNAGTSESLAFKTIQKGVDSSGPGDKIYVMDGTYQYRKNCGAYIYDHSGTPDHWILLAAYPGHHPKLEFTGYDCIYISASCYIIVSGFTIQGPANMITLEEAQAHQDSTDDPYYTSPGIDITGDGKKPANTTHSHHIILFSAGHESSISPHFTV